VSARVRRGRAFALAASAALLAQVLPMGVYVASAAVIEPGFQVATIISSLDTPTAMGFAPDGRIFVAERGGVVKEYDSASDTTPTTVVDLSTQVHEVGDRGLLGLAVDPQFPTRPYLYLLYMVDAQPGGTAPFYNDTCPLSPSGAKDGCPAAGRLSRITVGSNNQIVGSELVLVGGTYWCHQQQGHAVDHVRFGPDGALYVSSGDGGTASFTDWGQHSGAPDAIVLPNACGDPPAPAGQPLSLPTTEGGGLRSQDLRTSADPAQGTGAIVRVDPDTGAAMPDNPLVGNGVASDDRHIAYGLRNPFRFTFRPGTNELWVGDVGWDTWEEVNRIPDPRDAVVENFGWPCYEGAPRQSAWDNLNVNMCEQLYAAGSGAVTAPWWAFRHDAGPDQARCGNGGSALSGLAFAGPPYPVAYHGGLFLADYTKACLWAMMPGSNGLPNPANIKTILTNVFPVDLEIGPDGRLYYVDIALGTVNRLDSFSGNQPPIATFTATPPYGAVPLAVQFDASATTDDSPISGLTFQWDLDGDGQYDDATGVTASRTYSASTNVTVKLLVTDQSTATSVASFVVQPGNSPPTATIVTPTAATMWAAGDTISFSGTASDAQESLGPASMHWAVALFHCATQTQCHEHPQGTFDGVAGGSYVAPEHEYPSYLEVRLRVTDSRGLTSDASVRLDPKTIPVTFVTQPAGLQLTVGSGVVQTPVTITAILNSRISVTANSPQTSGGSTYQFSSWSDNGAISHDIVPPAGGATYTANFVPAAPMAALFVVGDPAALGTGDTAIRNRLVALGYAVTVVDDAASTAADATGKQVVVVSSSVISTSVGTKFRTTSVPVVVWEAGLWDDFGMTASAGTYVAGQQNLVIAAPGHPLAAGLTGTQTVASVAGDIGQASPNANAVVVARLSGATTASEFAYDAAAAMPGLAAPARRVGLFMWDTTAASFTANGTALFDAAITWAAGATALGGPADPSGTRLAALPPHDGLDRFGTARDGPRSPGPQPAWPVPATIPDGAQVKRPATLARAWLVSSRGARDGRSRLRRCR
jgi:glucose/arabinose dehydrogenase